MPSEGGEEGTGTTAVAQGLPNLGEVGEHCLSAHLCG